MGVKTIKLTEQKGGVAGALIVREHQELVFISQNGMVQRTGGQGHLAATAAPSQGVRVMNLREDDTVSAVASVVEVEADDGDDAPPRMRSRPIRAARTRRRPAVDADAGRKRREDSAGPRFDQHCRT